MLTDRNYVVGRGLIVRLLKEARLAGLVQLNLVSPELKLLIILSGIEIAARPNEREPDWSKEQYDTENRVTRDTDRESEKEESEANKYWLPASHIHESHDGSTDKVEKEQSE